jgi:hypothetical protein
MAQVFCFPSFTGISVGIRLISLLVHPHFLSTSGFARRLGRNQWKLCWLVESLGQKAAATGLSNLLAVAMESNAEEWCNAVDIGGKEDFSGISKRSERSLSPLMRLGKRDPSEIGRRFRKPPWIRFHHPRWPARYRQNPACFLSTNICEQGFQPHMVAHPC